MHLHDLCRKRKCVPDKCNRHGDLANGQEGPASYVISFGRLKAFSGYILDISYKYFKLYLPDMRQITVISPRWLK